MRTRVGRTRGRQDEENEKETERKWETEEDEEEKKADKQGDDEDEDEEDDENDDDTNGFMIVSSVYVFHYSVFVIAVIVVSKAIRAIRPFHHGPHGSHGYHGFGPGHNDRYDRSCDHGYDDARDHPHDHGHGRDQSHDYTSHTGHDQIIAVVMIKVTIMDTMGVMVMPIAIMIMSPWLSCTSCICMVFTVVPTVSRRGHHNHNWLTFMMAITDVTVLSFTINIIVDMVIAISESRSL